MKGDRHRRACALVLCGLSLKEIAKEMGITVRAVKFHVAELLKETNCKTRLEYMARELKK